MDFSENPKMQKDIATNIQGWEWNILGCKIINATDECHGWNYFDRKKSFLLPDNLNFYTDEKILIVYKTSSFVLKTRFSENPLLDLTRPGFYKTKMEIIKK